MTIFYTGLNLRFQKFKFLPQGINVMLSAVGFLTNTEVRRDKYPHVSGLRWLDSGGFTALNKYGDYPFSISRYLNLVAMLKPDYYATLDYPCEPNISRTLHKMTNAERILATVENSKQQLDMETMVGFGQCVPVIQGFTLDEYKSCIDAHAKAGTLRDYMAVGSMCRRIGNDELHRLIPGIAEYAKQANVTRLHFFGLKLSPQLAQLREHIYSQDSAVALDSYDKELRIARGGRRWPVGMPEKKAAFESFLERLSSLGLVWRSLTPAAPDRGEHPGR
jgi:hypothetical protein